MALFFPINVNGRPDDNYGKCGKQLQLLDISDCFDFSVACIAKVYNQLKDTIHLFKCRGSLYVLMEVNSLYGVDLFKTDQLVWDLSGIVK
jgi:hypothetical protein